MSDEIDRLYEAECAFVDRVKRGDKEAIDSTSLIERLRAEIERLAAEIVRLRAKVAKEIREAAKESVYAKGRSHTFVCGLQDGYEAAAQIACNDHRIIDLALENENERLAAENQKITSLQKLCPCGGLESGNHFSDCPYLLALDRLKSTESACRTSC